jgi:hypothetical protein
MPNQYKKGGSLSNSLKYEDYETASMAMGGGYEENIIVPQDVTGMYKKGGGVDSKRRKDFKTYVWKTKEDVLNNENEEIIIDENITEKEVIEYYQERMRRGYDFAVQIYEKGKNGKQIYRSTSFDKTLDELYNDDYAQGGGVDSKREYLEKRLWNERGYERDYLNKLSSKELHSLYDTEFYYDDKFKEGGDVPKANKMFHLPLELAVYVPSTQDVDKVISDSELDARVDEVSKYLATMFGGFTKSDKIGGFVSSKSELVTEEVVPVVSFATKEDYEANKNKLVTKLSEWARKWGQEAIGFEFEGDLYYVPQKFEGGGDIKKKNYEYMIKQKHAEGGEVDKEVDFAVVTNKEDKKFAEVGFTSDEIKKDNKGEYIVLQFDKVKKKYYLDDINFLRKIDEFTSTSKKKYLLLKEIQDDYTLYYYIIRLDDKKVYTEGGSMENIKEELSILTNGKHYLVKSGAYFEDGGDVRDFEWYQMWKKDQVAKGTAHEMEHIDTIREFKKRGVSDKQVAQAIAKDHLDENENYYIELEKMQESSEKVSNALQDFEHQKSKRKSSRKYNLGGLLGRDKAVNVHIILVEDYEAVVRSKDGTYVNDVNLKKDKVYKFGFLFDEGKDVAFDLGDGSNNFILIPSMLVVVVGYDEDKMELGGEVKSYADYKLDKNDKSILKLLLNINPMSATAEQRDKISTFKGNNVVNDLSPKLIQKIYGILFQNHNVDNRIKNLYINNIGVGNILMYAPTYLEKTMVGFDEKNEFVQVEKEIANIVTLGKRASVFNEFELTDMDGFIHVYPQVNPKVDDLCSVFYKSKKKAVAVGVCEFTSRQKLEEFQRSIAINQGSMTLSQMINFAKANDYLIVNEGITSEGDYTLIYTMTKY